MRFVFSATVIALHFLHLKRDTHTHTIEVREKRRNKKYSCEEQIYNIKRFILVNAQPIGSAEKQRACDDTIYRDPRFFDTERHIASSGTSILDCTLLPVLSSSSLRRAIVRPSRFKRGKCKSARLQDLQGTDLRIPTSMETRE